MEAIKALSEKVAGIVESGSNANGSWVKYADGTMIQYVYMEVTDQAINNAYGVLYQSQRVWTFPIPFVGIRPSVSCSQFQWGNGASWASIRGVSSTSAVLRGIDVSSREAGTTTTISAIAIRKMEIKRRTKTMITLERERESNILTNGGDRNVTLD